MRRTMILLACAAAASLLATPATAAEPTRSKSEPLVVRNLELPGCEFEVVMNDRGGGRTLTTVYEGDDVVRRMVTGSSTVELTGGPLRVSLEFTINERAVFDLTDDGLGATVTQQGQSGLVIDPGTTSGHPRLGWYTGRAVSTGAYDDTAQVPTLSDVETQSVHGLVDDVCEMLVSGIKTRH